MRTVLGRDERGNVVDIDIWGPPGTVVGSPSNDSGRPMPGEKGEPGDTGEQGPQGERGPEGPAGPKGDQGATGLAGADGATGPTGPEGPRGPAGETGPQGEVGPQGPKGDAGAQGQQGSAGPAGTAPAPTYASLGTATALALGTNDVVRISPSATGTLTTTVPTAGNRKVVILTQTNTTAKTITFGTGFKAVGTLALGTTANRQFAVEFVSDGTNLIEVGRTGAMAL